MRRLLIVMMALAFALSMPSTSNAEPGRWRRGCRQPVYSQPVYYQPAYQGYQRTGPVRQMFHGLMDMERRKNAWLMSTFFGR